MKTIDISNLEKGMTFPSYRQLCMAINQPMYSKATKKEQMKKWRENYFDFTESRARNRFGGHTITIKSVKTKKEIDSAIPKVPAGNNKYIELIEAILISSMKDGELICGMTQLYRKLWLVNYKFNIKEEEKDVLSDFKNTAFIKRNVFMRHFKTKTYVKANQLITTAIDSMVRRGLITVENHFQVQLDNETKLRLATPQEKTIIREIDYNTMKELDCREFGHLVVNGIVFKHFRLRTVGLKTLNIKCARPVKIYKYIYPTPYPILKGRDLENAKKELNRLFVNGLSQYMDSTKNTITKIKGVHPSAMFSGTAKSIYGMNFDKYINTLIARK